MPEPRDRLHGLAGLLTEWVDALTGTGLPASVTNPLLSTVHQVRDAATSATRATDTFTREFNQARRVAARGMTITGGA